MTERTEQIGLAIAWATEQRDWAAARIADIKKGERHFRGADPANLTEVTDKHREQYEQTVERMDRLIAAYQELG